MTGEKHNQRESDSFLRQNFWLEIDGIQSTGFKKVDGLNSSYEVIEERNGNSPNTKTKQRGLKTFDDITLTQGLSKNSDELEDWHESGDRRDVSVVQGDHLGAEVKRWNISNAFSKEFKPLDGLDAEASEVQIQSMVLAIEGYKRG